MTTNPDTLAMPQCLDPTLPYWAKSRAGTGLVALVAPAAPTDWADEILAGDDSAALGWTSAGPQPERTGLHILHRANVRAVSLAAAGRDLRRVWAAIQFAWRLSAPGPDGTTRQARLTSVDRPATVDRSVRLPHLITVRYGRGTVTDMVVWELMRRATAPEWCRISPADEAFVEANVHRLVTLRTCVRDGTLPETDAGRRLTDLLGVRPLTVRVVYRHLDLIRPVLDELGAPVRRRVRNTAGQHTAYAEDSHGGEDSR